MLLIIDTKNDKIIIDEKAYALINHKLSAIELKKLFFIRSITHRKFFDRRIIPWHYIQ